MAVQGNDVVGVAAERLAAALAQSTGADDSSGDISVDRDGRIHVDGPNGRRIVAEALVRPSRASLLDAWHQLRTYADAGGAVPVLVVPQLTQSLRELAASEGLNWVDFAGNAHLAAPPLFVHIEGKRDRPPRLGRGVDPFAGRSGNLVRLLLVEPDRTWRQKELVHASGLSQPRTSKVLATLEAMALVRRDDERNYRVADPEGLLDAWADVYSYRGQEIVPAHMSGEGIQLARELDAALEDADIIHWFTGLPAAWAYDHFARFRLVSVFVSADPESVLRDLGLRPAERGANVHLIAAGEQKLEIGQEHPDQLRCVHPAQVYIDLLGLPERAHEAAEHLRPRALARANP